MELKKSLKGLDTPRRNRYYYGKLLDEYHFQLEQSYMNEKRWMLNRLSLGTGVLCGLDVDLIDGKRIAIQPGVAIDACGREIVVPEMVCIDIPGDLLGGDRPGDNVIAATICLYYHECETDVTPVLACGCDSREDGMPSIVREQYRIAFHKGLPSKKPGLLTAEQCRKLFPEASPEAFDRRSAMCEHLPHGCGTIEDDCVVLATALYAPQNQPPVRLDACSYRSVLYSNAMLRDLILCLADRLDECCDQTPVGDPPRLTQIDFLSATGNKIGSLESTAEPAVIPEAEFMAQFRMVFNAAMLPDSFFAAGVQDDPIHASVLVTDLNNGSVLPGKIEFENDRMVRFVFDDEQSTDSIASGRYRVTLFGDVDTTGSRPAITGQNGLRFDGESLQLPSGDGTEGGNFEFEFHIVEPAFAVQSVYFLRSSGPTAGVLSDPTVPLTIPRSVGIPGVNRIRVDFSQDADLKTIVAGDENADPETFSILVTRTSLKLPPDPKTFVPAELVFHSPLLVEFKAPKEFDPGEYHVTLFGEKDPSGKRPAITSEGGQRLDGEPVALPSGDGNEGGDFTFRFIIEE